MIFMISQLIKKIGFIEGREYKDEHHSWNLLIRANGDVISCWTWEQGAQVKRSAQQVTQ